METNPRTHLPEWAPPPPVVSGDKIRPTPPPLPSAEAEFEATLGNLVDYFAALPPAEYGEPPALPLSTAPRRASRSYALLGIGSLAVGAVLAGGVLAGPRLLRSYPPAVTAQPQPPATAPKLEMVPISVRAVAPAQTEPLAEDATPTTSALPDENVPSPTAASASDPAAAPRHLAVKKVTKRATKSASATVARHAGRAGGASEDTGWEDPYK